MKQLGICCMQSVANVHYPINHKPLAAAQLIKVCFPHVTEPDVKLKSSQHTSALWWRQFGSGAGKQGREDGAEVFVDLLLQKHLV